MLLFPHSKGSHVPSSTLYHLADPVTKVSRAALWVHPTRLPYSPNRSGYTLPPFPKPWLYFPFPKPHTDLLMTVLTMGPPRGGLVLSSLTPGMHYGPLSIVQGPLPPPATVQLLGVLSKCLCQLWNLCLQHCELKELLIHPAACSV